jgi:serine/threonine protein kinase
MAPEIFDKVSYDISVDIWACGFILYIICSGGQHPIYRKSLDTNEYIKEVRKRNDWSFPAEFPL